MGRLRKAGLVGGGVPLEAGYKFSKPSAISTSLLSPLSLSSLLSPLSVPPPLSLGSSGMRPAPFRDKRGREGAVPASVTRGVTLPLAELPSVSTQGRRQSLGVYLWVCHPSRSLPGAQFQDGVPSPLPGVRCHFFVTSKESASWSGV